MNRIVNIIESDGEGYNSVNSSFHDAIDLEDPPSTPVENNQNTHQILAGASNLLAGRMATNYDMQTGEDGEGALEKACHNLKGYAWNTSDLGFYFQQVELKMRRAGVKNNYTKLLVLSSLLPENVTEQVKHILRKEETEFGAEVKPYNLLKKELIKIFKPPQEAAFERAMGRVLSGKPSELARQLVNDLCSHQLVGCCCKTFIVGLWKRALPSSVKSAVASLEFNDTNFDAIVQLADAVYASNLKPITPSVSAIGVAASGAVSLPGPPVLDQAFHPAFQEVAAVAYGQNRGGRGRGQGRGGRGGRGGQRGGRGGGQNQSQGQNQGQGQKGEIHSRHGTARHADQPPFKACGRHWRFGKSAHFCEEPATCPWKDIWIPRSNQ